jgi:hypothetical protein
MFTIPGNLPQLAANNWGCCQINGGGGGCGGCFFQINGMVI